MTVNQLIKRLEAIRDLAGGGEAPVFVETCEGALLTVFPAVSASLARFEETGKCVLLEEAPHEQA